MTVVVVPAYRPDGRMVQLVAALAALPDLQVVLVDDGSGPPFAPRFAEAAAHGATVLRHGVNRGKGRALKTGFAYVAAHRPDAAVVCADADGQHTVPDVLRVAAAVADPSTIVLGGRRLTGPGAAPVPLRSRVGNGAIRLLVRAVTGLPLHDTQTGLRGYPPALLGWLAGVPGERYEYEMRQLLEAGPAGIGVREVDVATVYLDRNASSHFRPVVDSVRVLAPVLAFAATSLVAFAVDTAGLLALHAATGSLVVAVVGARVLSGSVNLVLNRHLTFRGARHAPLPRVAARYWTLALGLLTAGYLLLRAATGFGVPLAVAKVGTDLALLGVSYRVQRAVVFRDRPPGQTAVSAPAGVRAVAGTGQASA